MTMLRHNEYTESTDNSRKKIYEDCDFRITRCLTGILQNAVSTAQQSAVPASDSEPDYAGARQALADRLAGLIDGTERDAFFTYFGGMCEAMRPEKYLPALQRMNRLVSEATTSRRLVMQKMHAALSILLPLSEIQWDGQKSCSERLSRVLDDYRTTLHNVGAIAVREEAEPPHAPEWDENFIPEQTYDSMEEAEADFRNGIRAQYASYLPQAEAGDPEAMYQLAECCRCLEREAASVVWHGRAAALGHGGAMFRLGEFCLEGRGMPENHVQAAYWFREAARCGNDFAGIIADMLQRLYQPHVDMDDEHFQAKADEFFQTLEYVQEGWLMYLTAECHLYGVGTGVSAERAAQMYLEAASLNYRPAIRAAAYCCDTGTGIPQNTVEALRLYQRAADLGDPQSMCVLADRYLSGRMPCGTDISAEQQTEQGLTLLRRAAEAGSAYAQRRLDQLK